MVHSSTRLKARSAHHWRLTQHTSSLPYFLYFPHNSPLLCLQFFQHVLSSLPSSLSSSLYPESHLLEFPWCPNSLPYIPNLIKCLITARKGDEWGKNKTCSHIPPLSPCFFPYSVTCSRTCFLYPHCWPWWSAIWHQKVPPHPRNDVGEDKLISGGLRSRWGPWMTSTCHSLCCLASQRCPLKPFLPTFTWQPTPAPQQETGSSTPFPIHRLAWASDITLAKALPPSSVLII